MVAEGLKTRNLPRPAKTRRATSGRIESKEVGFDLSEAGKLIEMLHDLGRRPKPSKRRSRWLREHSSAG
jgi:hypothetical protein